MITKLFLPNLLIGVGSEIRIYTCLIGMMDTKLSTMLLLRVLAKIPVSAFDVSAENRIWSVLNIAIA